jgi:cytochrome c-type biogenesis protein CcmH
MMWLALAIMTAAALGAVLWPLLRARGTPNATRASVAIYEAQIAEIDRDLASGTIAETDARSAKHDAARRLIAEQPQRKSSAQSMSRRFAAGGIAIVACAICALLYARIGQPLLPDAPLAARAPSQSMDFAAALTKIESHLATAPDDLRGWSVIAPVYLKMGRGDDAVRAYGNILRLKGASAETEADYGEALVHAAQGDVPPDARTAFEAALQFDATSAKARYYLGLAAERDGDRTKAREIWGALAAEAPPESSLAQALRQRIAALDGPPPDSVSPEAAQNPAIRAMVERLATRLHDSGGDIEEWLRLVRAWRVLDENDKARTALSDARKTFARDSDATARLDALAHELGLES